MKKGKGSSSLGSKESSGRPSTAVLVFKKCARFADSSESAEIQQDGKEQLPERQDSLDAKECKYEALPLPTRYKCSFPCKHSGGHTNRSTGRVVSHPADALNGIFNF